MLITFASGHILKRSEEGKERGREGRRERVGERERERRGKGAREKERGSEGEGERELGRRREGGTGSYIRKGEGEEREKERERRSVSCIPHRLWTVDIVPLTDSQLLRPNFDPQQGVSSAAAVTVSYFTSGTNSRRWNCG